MHECSLIIYLLICVYTMLVSYDSSYAVEECRKLFWEVFGHFLQEASTPSGKQDILVVIGMVRVHSMA